MEKYDTYWEKICQIYLLTKHYLLLAEELSDDFDTFLQPLKEHRDAFDHIVRVYGYQFLDNPPLDPESYCLGNVKKALGHEYRAFFDTADWLSYICRKKIREMIKENTGDEISRQYPDYPDIKQWLNQLPKDIAKIRENKDVSDKGEELIAEVNKYKHILDRLLKVYDDLCTIFGA